MELSKRLSAVAGLVTEGASVADIGTDHGYIPLYLAQKNPQAFFLAMDVNEGPLQRAREHIRAAGMEERIGLRLSDGLGALRPGEVDTMIAAGMGGGLILRILAAHPQVTASIREFILQPQSEIEKVRASLEEQGYQVVREDMVEEDGKYYPMMKMIHGRETPPMTKVEHVYGRKLLQQRHPVLFGYLQREKRLREEILEQLRLSGSEKAGLRRQEVLGELSIVDRALEYYTDTDERRRRDHAL